MNIITAFEGFEFQESNVVERFPDLALSDEDISSIAAMPVASYVCERGLRDVNVFLRGLPKAHGVL